MQRTQAATPGPVYGMPRISSSYCAVPSSPPRPVQGDEGDVGLARRAAADEAPSASIARTSWPSAPSASSTRAPERSETARSSERPPLRTATFTSSPSAALRNGKDVRRSGSPSSSARARACRASRPGCSGHRLVEIDLLGDDRADPADPLADLVLVWAGEVEPHRAAAAAVDEGRLAGDEGDVLAQRLGEQVGRVDVVGQGRPDEQAALGLRPGRLAGKCSASASSIDVAAAAVDAARLVDVVAPAPFAEVLADEVLAQRRGAEVGGLLAEHELLEHRRRRADPADPDPGERIFENVPT